MLDVKRCVLLCMQDAMRCVSEVPEVSKVMHCVLLCLLGVGSAGGAGVDALCAALLAAGVGRTRGAGGDALCATLLLEAGEDGLCLPEVIRCKLKADVGHRESVCKKVVRKLASEPEQRRNNAKIFSIIRHEHEEAKRAGPQV